MICVPKLVEVKERYWFPPELEVQVVMGSLI